MFCLFAVINLFVFVNFATALILSIYKNHKNNIQNSNEKIEGKNLLRRIIEWFSKSKKKTEKQYEIDSDVDKN